MILFLFLLISSYGFYSFDEMGYNNILLNDTNKNYTVFFYLHENAAQGPEEWYLVYLNFTIEFGKGEGLVYVSADTNGYTCMQIKFEVSNGSIIYSWANFTEFSKNTVNSRNISIFFINYLRYRGVKGGKNSLTIKIE